MGKTPPKPWRPGQSGNPAGRKPGTSKLTKLRQAIEADLHEIIATLVISAKSGDPAAARLLLDRVVPSLKPAELPVALKLDPDSTLTEQGRVILAAVADGQLAPTQAATLVAAVASLGRTIEIDELVARIAKLEAAGGAKT